MIIFIYPWINKEATKRTMFKMLSTWWNDPALLSATTVCGRDDSEDVISFKDWNAKILNRLRSITYPEFSQAVSNINSQKTEVIDN